MTASVSSGASSTHPNTSPSQRPKGPKYVRGTHEGSPILPLNRKLRNRLATIASSVSGSETRNKAALDFARTCQEILTRNLIPDQKTYDLTLMYAVYMDHWTLLVHLLEEMRESGFTPTLATFPPLFRAINPVNCGWRIYLLLACMKDQGIPMGREAYEAMISLRLYPMCEFQGSRSWGPRDSSAKMTRYPQHIEIALAELLEMLSMASNPSTTTSGNLDGGMREKGNPFPLGELLHLPPPQKPSDDGSLLSPVASLQPSTQLIDRVIEATARVEEPRVAVELAKMAKGRGIYVDPATYHTVLASCAYGDYMEGIHWVWNTLVEESGNKPLEGLCVHLLWSAGRKGDTALAASLIRYLHGKLQVKLTITHFSPLLEAHSRLGNVAELSALVTYLKTQGLGVTGGGKKLDLRLLRGWRDQLNVSVERVDSAYMVLKGEKEKKRPVEEEMFITLLDATIDLGEPRRTMALWEGRGELLEKEQLDKGALELYSSMLSLCRVTSDTGLMDRLIQEMKDLGVPISMQGYMHMIGTCLSKQGPEWERAFHILDQVRLTGRAPPREMILLLIERCMQEQDHRGKLLMEEMTNLGYVIPETLEDYFVG
ncbi:MAG: hypothetical protein DHS80DRAFT_29390 [Piptocephalis tieghemiana]|nr:MAG: hypothetical protein DHS80DRAFT_29390 [Piptocephalis tieghemiana]